jgi:hypothetical protein
MLALTLLTMSGATFLIGILPTYASWGMAAPILLFLLRCAQGFSTGEYTGASAFIVEYAPVFRSLEQHDEVEPAPLREAVRRCGRQIATLFGYSITNPAKVRASGYTAAYALFGGTAPFVATGLVPASGSAIAPAFYMIVIAVVSLVVVLTSFRETRGLRLERGVDATVPATRG